MIKRTYMLILPVCLLHLSVAGPSLADEVEDEEAQRCIQVRTIRRTDVLDDLNIFFYMRGKAIYHNTLLRQCKGLSRDRRFSYTSSVNRLCYLDSIRILHDSGWGLQEGRSCQLGYFRPVTEEDIELIIERKHTPPPAKPLPTSEPEEITKEAGETENSPPQQRIEEI
jgi:hypothetical protein